MREQLIQYVELLFAGGRDCEDIQQEILQNTLDRYDDLISQGKVPEAAYRLAISGIGDINEILGTVPTAVPERTASQEEAADTPQKKRMRAFAVGLYILCPIPLIFMSGLGADILGLIGTLVLVAIATVMMILNSKKEQKEHKKEQNRSPMQKSVTSLLWAIGLAVYFLWSFTSGAWYMTWVVFPILGALDDFVLALVAQKEQTETIAFSMENPNRETIGKCIWALGIALYIAVSIVTGAWYATWLMLPITGAFKGLVNAILDYKEAVKNET